MSLRQRRGASTSAACQLCAGVVGGEAIKILTGRGQVRPAPWRHQFDTFTGRYRSTRAFLGKNDPRFQARLWGARKLLARLEGRAIPRSDATLAITEVERVIDAARWAPSGDNLQPWRFTLNGPDRFTVRLMRDPTDSIDNDGSWSGFSLGCMLENIQLAAAHAGRKARWTFADEAGACLVAVDISNRVPQTIDPLWRMIEKRATDRRAYARRPLTHQEKASLQEAVGPDFVLHWFDGPRAAWRIVAANVMTTDTRLRAQRGQASMRVAVDFASRFPGRGMASKALGVSAMSETVLRWSLRKFSRSRVLERSGLLALSHLESSVVPGVASGAHVALVWREPQHDPLMRAVQAGAAFQRLWLQATALGLAMQPQIGALALALGHAKSTPHYADEVPHGARRVHDLLAPAFEVDINQVAAIARIGEAPSKPLESRAMRLSLDSLITNRDDHH